MTKTCWGFGDTMGEAPACCTSIVPAAPATRAVKPARRARRRRRLRVSRCFMALRELPSVGYGLVAQRGPLLEVGELAGRARQAGEGRHGVLRCGEVRRVGEVQDLGEVVRGGVAGSERGQLPAPLDRLEDGGV